MALEVDEVAAVALVRCVPEVLLPRTEQRADGSEAREMPSELVVVLVRAHHHHHRVPAANGADALLVRDIAGRRLLHVRRNRVDVRRIRRERNVRARAARLVDQPLKKKMRTLGTFALEHRLERIEPFLRLLRIGIVRGGQLRNGGHGGAPELVALRLQVRLVGARVADSLIRCARMVNCAPPWPRASSTANPSRRRCFPRSRAKRLVLRSAALNPGSQSCWPAKIRHRASTYATKCAPASRPESIPSCVSFRQA